MTYDVIKTPKGGYLTIVDSYRSKGKTRLKLSCSICNEDKELCPEPFDVLEFELLKRGSIPCLCSKKPNYTQEQKLIIIKRKCKGHGYKLIEFPNNITMRGRLGIFNPETKNYWKPKVNDFWNDKSHDPALNLNGVSRVNNNISHIKDNLPKHIYDIVNVDSCWFYKCKVCSSDIYVKAGLCDGMFKTSLRSIRAGKLSCRCSRSPRWTQEQRELQVRSKLESWHTSGIFSWEDGFYKNTASKIIFKTSCGHESIASTGNLLLSKSEVCTFCNSHRKNNKNGHYPNRESEEDILYIVKLNDDTFKVGRSFKTRCKYRLNTIKKHCPDTFKIIKTYEGCHKDVYEVEQTIISYLGLENALLSLTFTNEAFVSTFFDKVVDIIKGSGNLKEVTNGI